MSYQISQHIPKNMTLVLKNQNTTESHGIVCDHVDIVFSELLSHS